MPTLNFIIFCDKAFVDPSDNKLSIIGIFNIIKARDFPAIHPAMTVVVGADGLEARDYKETLKISKDDKVILETSQDFRKPSCGKHQFIHNLYQVKFPEAGEYNVEMLLDGNVLGNTSIVAGKL